MYTLISGGPIGYYVCMYYVNMIYGHTVCMYVCIVCMYDMYVWNVCVHKRYCIYL